MKRTVRGFTLLELLITLVLMGLVMLLVFGGLRITSRIWEAAEQRQQQVAEHYQLQQVLRRLISQAQNRRVRDQEGRVQLAFKGEADQLIFVAPASRSNSGTGASWYRLYQAPASSDQPAALMLQARPFASGEAVDWVGLFEPGVTDLSEPVVLSEYQLLPLSDASVRLVYWGQQDRWLAEQPDWVEQSVLPRLVEVHIEFESEMAAEAWPVLAVGLQEYLYDTRRQAF